MHRYLPKRHIRVDGKIYWQPRYDDQSLFDQFTVIGLSTIKERVWAYKGSHGELKPVLYRSRQRALRIGIRQHKRVLKRRLRTEEKEL